MDWFCSTSNQCWWNRHKCCTVGGGLDHWYAPRKSIPPRFHPLNVFSMCFKRWAYFTEKFIELLSLVVTKTRMKLKPMTDRKPFCPFQFCSLNICHFFWVGLLTLPCTGRTILTTVEGPGWTCAVCWKSESLDSSGMGRTRLDTAGHGPIHVSVPNRLY